MALPAEAVVSSLDEQRKNFTYALELLDKNRFREFDQTAELLEDYPLYSYLIYKKLTSQLDSDQEIESYLKNYPDSLNAIALKRKWLFSLAKRKNWSEFLKNYRETSNIPLQCHYYWALYNTGRKDEAFEGAGKLWSIGASRPKACDPLFAAWRKTPSFTQRQVWSRFILSVKNNQLGLAGYLKKMLSKKNQQKAQFWLDVHKQPEYVQDCSNWGVMDSSLQAEVFQHGFDRLSIRDPFLAMKSWQLHKEFLELSQSDIENMDGKIALRLAYRKHEKAYDYLSAISDGDERIRTWRVRSALNTGDWNAVLASLDRLTESEKKDASWRYWRARSLAGLGKTEQAQEIYTGLAKNRNFHGFLAADKIGSNYQFNDRPIPVSAQEIDEMADELQIKIVREFLHFNMLSQAKGEWWYAIQKMPADKIRVAAKLAQSWDWHQTAIFTIAVAKKWNDLDLRFPLAYKRDIIKEAQANQMDPAIIYGLIRRESAFDKHAHSPAGARGLMQIMPATGKSVAKKLRDKWKSAEILYKPKTNLRYGSSYFKGLLERFDNNYVMAAAGYNAGPHRVEQWQPKEGSIDADVWAETIPFTETRKYVAAVLEYFAIYRKKLGLEQLRISDVALKVPSLTTEKKVARRDEVHSCG